VKKTARADRRPCLIWVCERNKLGEVSWADFVEIQVPVGGTRADHIRATLDWMATAPPCVASATVPFDGERIDILASVVRAQPSPVMN
jgi:hypothetical protein